LVGGVDFPGVGLLWSGHAAVIAVSCSSLPGLSGGRARDGGPGGDTPGMKLERARGRAGRGGCFGGRELFGCKSFEIENLDCEINGESFSPDSKRFVTTFYDNSVRVWDTQTGKEHARIVGHAQVQ
jgi:WD40 repeat protein